MRVYEITIKPSGGFATPLKGDTLFGHFFWQLVYDNGLANKTPDELLATYGTRPFVIFSSAYPKYCVGKYTHYALKIPSLPSDMLLSLPSDRLAKMEALKKFKKKRWMLRKEDSVYNSFRGSDDYIDNNELSLSILSNMTVESAKSVEKSGAGCFASVFQPHNTVNRLTNCTGAGQFAPYSVEYDIYAPEVEFALFVGIDEEAITIDQVRAGLERIGETGFGKDASTGMGRFSLGEDTEIELASIGSKKPNACYTLGPCVPEKGVFKDMFFAPFTRFGKHGDVLAKSANPFKNPVIMADEGAVFVPGSTDIFHKPYIGSAVTGVSLAEPKSVVQGYSLYIPVRLGD